MSKAKKKHESVYMTPERTMQAGAQVEVSDNPVKKERVTRVYDNWPIYYLANRDVITAQQYKAGFRYYGHWYYTGIPGVSGGMNMIYVDKPPPGSETCLTGADFKQFHSDWYAKSEQALGPRYSPIVNKIVLEEMDIKRAAGRFTDYKDRAISRALVIEKLKEGLERLIDCYSGGK